LKLFIGKWRVNPLREQEVKGKGKMLLWTIEKTEVIF
jgi:hypothetical protein